MWGSQEVEGRGKGCVMSPLGASRLPAPYQGPPASFCTHVIVQPFTLASPFPPLMVQGENRELITWWAKYCESQGDLEGASRLYDRAGDALSMVRILCHARKFVAAEEEVERLGDPAAAFHLARQYEAHEKIPDAIRYYSQVLSGITVWGGGDGGRGRNNFWGG